MDLSKTLTVKVDASRPDKDVIKYAARIVKNGGIVAFPTETVYGLAVNLSDKNAVERLYKIKRRFRGKPLTVHISSVRTITKMNCRITRSAAILIKKYWPGPLTVLLPSRDGSKVGFRMPANKVALDLIASAGVGIAAPSANLSGKKPPVNARGVLKDLDGKIDMLLDSGPTKVGIESTVVDLTGDLPVVMRHGAIKESEIFRVLKM